MRMLLTLSCVLASAYGLGDVFPYPNAKSVKYADQVASPWTLGVCTSGTKQSPINVVTKSAKKPTEDPGKLSISGYEQAHKYGMDTSKTEIYLSHLAPPAATKNLPFTPLISGGPLPLGVSYAFNHIEFHWGTVNTVGSEHSFDGTFAPLEMQIVHYTTAAATYAAAVTAATATPDPAAIAVMSFQFEISTTDNPALTEIIKLVLPAVAGKKADLATAIKLSDLIDPRGMNVLDEYYYYDGSLTLPANALDAQGCLEAVRWILFPTKLKISQTQLDAFRALTGHAVLQTAVGTYNGRLIKTNTNTVYHRKEENETTDNIATILGATVLGVGTFSAVYNLLNNEDTSKALTANPVVDFLQDFEERFISPGSPVEERLSQYQPNPHHHPQQIQY